MNQIPKQSVATKTNAKLAVWKHLPDRYFSDCLKIQPKVGENCSLILNQHQTKIQGVIDGLRREGKPVRIIILKPRQTGISTHSCSNLFHAIRFNRGTGMVVSKDLDSSEHIFSIVQRFYHYLPESERRVLKTLASNRKELKFEEPHGGRILVETAGKTAAGHSFTIRHLLLSEVSRWPEGCEDTITGLLNAIPNKPNTTVIIESVANGMAGWFHEIWHKEDSDYVKIFLPWFEHNEYRKELPIPADRYEKEMTDEENEFRELYRLDLEQIEWRRWAIRNNCQDNPEKFKEQYPATAREAFIASGNTFFDIPTLDKIPTNDGLKCNLKVVENLSGKEEIKPDPHTRGWLEMWKRPQPNHSYVIGADVAEGLEIDGAPADDKHDYSSADVIDAQTGEQVAHFHARITPDEFGRQLTLLARWYNDAFVGIETNGGYGQHVLTEMIREEHPEHKLYRRQVLDETSRRTTRKLGWCTTKANRRPLMSALDRAIRQKEVFINCHQTIDEMRSFIVKPNGRIEGGNGRKDDRVFSLALAYEMLGAANPSMEFHPDGYNEEVPTVTTTYKLPRSIYRRPSNIYA